MDGDVTQCPLPFPVTLEIKTQNYQVGNSSYSMDSPSTRRKQVQVGQLCDCTHHLTCSTTCTSNHVCNCCNAGHRCIHCKFWWVCCNISATLQILDSMIGLLNHFFRGAARPISLSSNRVAAPSPSGEKYGRYRRVDAQNQPKKIRVQGVGNVWIWRIQQRHWQSISMKPMTSEPWKYQRNQLRTSV